jgi:Ion channel
MSDTPSIASAHASRAYTITGHKFLLLFLFLLGTLIYYPYAGNSTAGFYIFRLLGGAVILLSVYAVSFRRSLVLFALVLAVPAIVERSQVLRDYTGALPLINTGLSLVFDIFIIVVIFRRVFGNDRPNAETIFGALCIYLLIGFSFASMYTLLATVQPHAFYLNPATNLRAVPSRFDLIYYSFGSMTALGASGITPASDQARSLSIIEAIVGVLYLAVLISRLMGTYRQRLNG